MIKLSIPATSANLGSGFDCLGVSLELYNHVYIEEADRLEIRSSDGAAIPTDENNLIYRTLCEVYQAFGKEAGGFHILQENNIPMTRGLGSSSACIVAGVMAANHFLQSPMDQQDMINFACRLEGHPDNSTPAIKGGFVASVYQEGKVHCVKVPLNNKVRFAAFIPDFELKTEVARAVLPTKLDYKDAVYNLSRAALMSISLLSGDYQNLAVAAEDRLHQPYRLGFIKGAEKLMRATQEMGAYCTYLSGAGPTIMCIVDRNNEQFFRDAQAFLDGELPGFRLHRLEGDDAGARLEEMNREVIKWD